MPSIHDWKTLIVRHARESGAPDLAPQTLDELAAYLEDLYLDSLRQVRSEADAYRAATAALSESVLATVPRSRTRAPESRPVNAGRGVIGVAGDLRGAWRQWRRSPSFAAIAILTLGLGAGAATAIFVKCWSRACCSQLPARWSAQWARWRC